MLNKNKHYLGKIKMLKNVFLKLLVPLQYMKTHQVLELLFLPLPFPSINVNFITEFIPILLHFRLLNSTT